MLLLPNKLIEKITDLCNDKQRYQSFVRRNITKSVKQSEIITYQPKAFENSYIVDVKSVITEHLKTSHKLSNTIRQTEKLGSNRSLLVMKKKLKSF